MQQQVVRKADFPSNECSHCNLSIQAGPDGFSFVIHHPGTGEVMFFDRMIHPFAGDRSLFDKISETINEEHLLNQTFNDVSLIIADRKFSLIPNISQAERLVNYMQPGRQLAVASRETHTMQLDPPGLIIAYSAYRPLVHFLEMRFNRLKVDHEASNLIHNLLSSGITNLVFHLHPSWLYALCIRNSSLHFFNTFETRSNSDRIYFIRLITEHLRMFDKQVFLTGEENDKPILQEILRESIPGVTIPVDEQLPLLTNQRNKTLNHQLFGILTNSI